MKENPTITIGTLVRDRAWVLPYYLDGIRDINYDKSKINLVFVLNHNTDNSEEILKTFKSQNPKYNSVKIKTMNFKGQPKDSRNMSMTNSLGSDNNRLESYPYLAELRNYLTSLINTDYFFSIDSDIIITEPEILNRLLAHNKHVVSALICNGFIKYPNNPFQWLNTGLFSYKTGYNSLKPSIIRKMLKNNETLFETDLTGAIYLISKEVYKNPYIKYGYTSFGEDLFWCICAKRQGYKLYTDVTLYQQHIMSEEYLQKYFDKELPTMI